MSQYVLAIDQGTTSSRALVVDHDFNIKGVGQHEFAQHYPKPGWVEHKLDEIWDSTVRAIADALKAANIQGKEIAAIGITNQRETTCLWERASGKPAHNAVVWQCRRSADICKRLKEKGHEQKFKEKTGLVLDPYFSGTKLTWLMEQLPVIQKRAASGELVFGTIDTFLVWKMTGGKVHVTDVSNASRTLLMNLKTLQWDPELCEILGVSPKILPQIASSSEIYGKTSGISGLPDGIPIAGIAGDQQAALFGQACFAPGEAKCTYGTGSFILMNTGGEPKKSNHGLLTTVAWKIKNQTTYALEGSAFIAGAAVQWLRDGLQIIQKSSEVEALAAQVEDSGGVFFVPALVGLGAPHWKPEARGTIVGLTRGTTRAHIARATLEGIAFSQYDILEAMTKDLGRPLAVLKVDGGAAANNLLMQFQSDILQTPISRPAMLETTALGAAFLAGLAVCFWKSQEEIRKTWREEKRFTPKMSIDQVHSLTAHWKAAVFKA